MNTSVVDFVEHDERITAEVSPRAMLEAVGAACVRLQASVRGGTDMAGVFHEIRPILQRIAHFEATAFVAVDDDGLEFSVEAVDGTDEIRLRREIDHHVASGGFAWALYQNRPVLVPSRDDGRWTLLHSLGTPARSLGMFVGTLPSHMSHPCELTQAALSSVLMHCSSVLEAVLLQRELSEHNARLEAAVMERTAKLQASEEAARAASSAKSDFLANMSHEVRTPLNGIVGMGSLLAESRLDEDQQEQVQTINLSATSLLGLINDILDMSKVEAGQLTLETVPFDLYETLEQVVMLLAPQAAARKVEIFLQYRGTAPRSIYGDPMRIRQIISNLVGNAVKFTEQGQIVVDVTMDGRSGALRIAVEDSGIGIPAERVEGIFDSFAQADSSTTRQFGGTGLGLAISRRLAHLMDGEIGLVSSQGVGSTFTFGHRPRMIDHAPTHEYDLCGQSVLVVSKRTGLLTSLSDVIAGAGGVMRHVDAPEMLTDELPSLPASARHPSAILVDIEWGERSFDWVARETRQAIDSDKMLLVALVPPGDRPLRDRLLEAGFDACLPRPVQEQRLLATLTGRSDHVGDEPDTPTLPLARILVAEDDPVNTAVVVMMLKRLGCVVQTVETGSEAVTAAASDEFDLILMDCIMPEMDGYMATQEIRVGPHGQTPIIALTASASPVDRSRCLAAGMDDYLAKPFDVRSLRETVRRWIGAAVPSGAPSFEERTEIYDHGAALERLGGNETVLHEVLELFVNDWPDLEHRLLAALDTRNAPALHMIAHRVKSTAGILSAGELAEAAIRAETHWASGDLARAEQYVASLRARFKDFNSEVSRTREVHVIS